jgi:adenosylmethionine-8-amino-7-oxononanoate aminotransferase
MPPELSRTLLTNSGTEGIEAALLIAGMYAQLSGEPRTRVVTFARGYHGSTLLSREMSGLPHLAHPFASPLDVTRIDLPLSARETRDVAGLPALVEEFRRALLDVEPPPLAVLIEPLLNVGGGVVLPAGFLTEVRRLCDESGALLVLDEVSTGYGRTGRMFAFQHDDVVPDIVVTSKGLAAGYAPISAVNVRESIYRQFEQDPLVGGLRFGQTTSGHAISCAAALATLDVIERDGLVERADRAGRLLTSRIVSVADGDTVADVRGLGLFVSVEFTREPDAERVVAEAEARGLLLRRQGAVVMLVPPLTVDDAALESIADRFAAALKEVAA